jgi:hypothetical protein
MNKSTCEHCKALRLELESVRKELTEVKEHLKKYTAPERSRVYYQTHKHEITSDPEYKKRRKEINQRAYQKRKAKLMEHATESPATTTYESAITYDDETDCDTTPYTSPTL